MRILTPKQQTLLRDERRVLSDLRVVLARLGMREEDEESLKQSIQQLEDLFLIVVVGEFNSGKSLVINALLGQRLLEEGVTPTTTQVQVLHYGPTSEKITVNEHQVVLTSPVDFLSEICIVDTPGTNAIIRKHETITTQFVPPSDLVLFVTSADRPFTESERVFLEYIREWGKKVVFVSSPGWLRGEGSTKTESWVISDREAFSRTATALSMPSGGKHARWSKRTIKTGNPGPLRQAPRQRLPLPRRWERALWVWGRW